LFCTVPYDDLEACAEISLIPPSLADGVNTVADLLALANAALGGDDTFDIGDIYSAVTSYNEGFDECRTIVPCIRPEICDNGCDDDLDGDIDCCDSECSDYPDCQEICNDGIDNDCDEAIDCADEDCIGDPACPVS